MINISNMSPRKIYDGLPPNTTFDVQKGKYRYRNPLTGKRPWLGSDKNRAIELAKKANLAIVLKQQLSPLVPTFGIVVNKMLDEWVYEQPWSDGYRKIIITRLKAINKEWSALTFNEITRKRIRDWLKNRASNGQTFNKWRELFINIWEFAILDELVNFNEAGAVPKMSTSKKLEANWKKRKRLTTKSFWAIHDHKDTPLFLQIAMEQSLITLQSRQQIVDTRMSDYKDGFLYYIRKKTAGDTDMAFIKIEITGEIDLIRRRSLDGIASPYLVHKRPERKDHDKIKKKPHWTYIWPEQLTRAFAKARDLTGLFDDWLPEEKPGFHEIRSLGGRTYRAKGYPDKYIQGLMTHTDMKTTEIYLSDPDRLQPDHFRKVKAGMSLTQAKDIEL